MAEEGQEERTEEATQFRREEFRKRGQVANTKELSSALFLLIGSLLVYFLSHSFLNHFFDIFHITLGKTMIDSVRDGDFFSILKFSGFKFFLIILPILGTSFFIALGSTMLQTGILNVENVFEFKFERINPLEGIKKILSLRNLVEGIKALLKLIFISLIAYFLIRHELNQIPRLIDYNIEQILQYMGIITFKLLFGIGLIILILSIFDYFFQRWDLEKRMMMTKHEVKEEHKSREGDPLVRARIRRVQREVAHRRMMEKVPQADVIITNPTHIAVALKYDDKLPAPQLIAKGADLIAEKIKEIANRHKVPIVENKPLARTIFKTIKIGQIIPRDLFVSVAEVLAFVYKLKKKKGA